MTEFFSCEGCGDDVPETDAVTKRVDAGPLGSATLAVCPDCRGGRGD